MKILITAATVPEIRPMLDKLNFISRENEKISNYQYRNINIDVLITGIGMVPTAYHLSKLFAVRKYDLAINAGICGAFSSELPIGEVLNITEDFFAELGAEDKENFISIFELGLDDPNEGPYTDGKLVNPFIPDLKVVQNMRKATGITVNTVHGRKESILNILKQFSPETESMEGGAFFYSCFMENQPCIQIRAVSNRVEERNRPEWNVELALKNLNKKLIEILNELK